MMGISRDFDEIKGCDKLESEIIGVLSFWVRNRLGKPRSFIRNLKNE